MFLIILKYKSKNDRVNFPVDFEINPIIPSDYYYTTENTGNVQDANGCSSTIDYTKLLDFTGNNQNTIQNDVLLIPPQSDGSEISPKKTIRFDGHLEASKKPFKNYHIKHTSLSDVLIIPFSFDDSFAPINRIYSLWGLLFFVGVLRYPFDHWPLVKNANKPLTFDIIKMTSINEISGHTDNNHSLIYGSHIYKQNIKNKHREAMTINDYSSMIGINKMHKKYAFILKCKYVYVRNIVYVYIKNCLYGFKRTIVQRGVPGIRPREYI